VLRCSYFSSAVRCFFWASARRSASRRPVERGPTENTR
jgi:hypothetical protein